MIRTTEPTLQLIASQGGEVVPLRHVVSSIWAGQASPTDYEVVLATVVSQSNGYIMSQTTEESNGKTRSLMSQRTNRSEV